MSKSTLKRKKGGEISTVDAAITEVRARFGSHSIFRASEAKFIEVTRQRSGIAALDFATGGGFPYGRYIHIYGPEGVSKTFISLHTAAQVQRDDKNAVVVWVDLERVFDRRRAKQVGVDLTRLILVNEESIEQNLSIAETFINVPGVRLFVIDSVAAIITISELESEVEEQTMGVGPRLLNKFLRRWTAKTAPKSNKAPESFVILINQVREKIAKGFVGRIPPKPVPTGGRGVRFFTSIAIELAKGDKIELSTSDDDGTGTVIGHEVKARIVKNNTFPPDRVGKFLLCTRPFDVGGYSIPANAVDNMRDLVRYARFYNVFQVSGSWLSYEGYRWQGRVSAQKALHDDPQLQEKLYQEVMNAIECKLGVHEAADATKRGSGTEKLKALAGKKTTRKR